MLHGAFPGSGWAFGTSVLSQEPLHFLYRGEAPFDFANRHKLAPLEQDLHRLLHGPALPMEPGYQFFPVTVFNLL